MYPHAMQLIFNIVTEVTSVSSTPYLVVANVHYIREITLDGQSFNPIVRGQGIRSLSYHYKYSVPCITVI